MAAKYRDFISSCVNTLLEWVLGLKYAQMERLGNWFGIFFRDLTFRVIPRDIDTVMDNETLSVFTIIVYINVSHLGVQNDIFNITGIVISQT